MRVELGYCFRHFFEVVTDEQFLASFGELLPDKFDRPIEEALLLLSHTDPVAQQAGADRLLAVSFDERGCHLLEERGIAPFDFFERIGEVDIDRLKERAMVQAAHDEVVLQRDAVQAAHDEVVLQRDAVQAAHDEVLGSFSYRVLRPVRVFGSRVRWLWKRGRA
jgi:hypothetical protein